MGIQAEKLAGEEDELLLDYENNFSEHPSEYIEEHVEDPAEKIEEERDKNLETNDEGDIPEGYERVEEDGVTGTVEWNEEGLSYDLMLDSGIFLSSVIDSATLPSFKLTINALKFSGQASWNASSDEGDFLTKFYLDGSGFANSEIFKKIEEHVEEDSEKAPADPLPTEAEEQKTEPQKSDTDAKPAEAKKIPEQSFLEMLFELEKKGETGSIKNPGLETSAADHAAHQKAHSETAEAIPGNAAAEALSAFVRIFGPKERAPEPQQNAQEQSTGQNGEIRANTEVNVAKTQTEKDEQIKKEPINKEPLLQAAAIKPSGKSRISQIQIIETGKKIEGTQTKTVVEEEYSKHPNLEQQANIENTVNTEAAHKIFSPVKGTETGLSEHATSTKSKNAVESTGLNPPAESTRSMLEGLPEISEAANENTSHKTEVRPGTSEQQKTENHGESEQHQNHTAPSTFKNEFIAGIDNRIDRDIEGMIQAPPLLSEAAAHAVTEAALSGITLQGLEPIAPENINLTLTSNQEANSDHVAQRNSQAVTTAGIAQMGKALGNTLGNAQIRNINEIEITDNTEPDSQDGDPFAGSDKEPEISNRTNLHLIERVPVEHLEKTEIVPQKPPEHSLEPSPKQHVERYEQVERRASAKQETPREIPPLQHRPIQTESERTQRILSLLESLNMTNLSALEASRKITQTVIAQQAAHVDHSKQISIKSSKSAEPRHTAFENLLAEVIPEEQTRFRSTSKNDESDPEIISGSARKNNQAARTLAA